VSSPSSLGLGGISGETCFIPQLSGTLNLQSECQHPREYWAKAVQELDRCSPYNRYETMPRLVSVTV